MKKRIKMKTTFKYNTTHGGLPSGRINTALRHTKQAESWLRGIKTKDQLVKQP